MNIFDATEKLKDYTFSDNPQLVNVIGEDVELSGFCPLPILLFHDKINDIDDYLDLTTHNQSGNYLFDSEIMQIRRILKTKKEYFTDKLTPKVVNTKEYWQFLHETFPFCDVCSYYRTTNLESYFEIKGQHYDSIIEQMGIDFFKDKKILEIGPGYGYLPKILKELNVKHQYYCADIVQRFDHDNFIDVNGYTLSNITDKFDIILVQDVIQHLGIDIFKNYTTEMRDMLTDDGVIIIGTEMVKKDNHSWFFFGQLINMFGTNTMFEHMKKLKYDVNLKPLNMVGKRIGTILIFDQSTL